MSKESFEQRASNLFATTSHNILFANPKGEFFTSENIGRLSLVKDEKLIKFERPKETTSETKELSANETIVKIKAVESLEDLKEFEGDNRKSVKSVYDWKKNKLTETIIVNGTQTLGNGNKDTDIKK